MINQSFRHVLVPKIGTALLADGATVATLVDGQLGILDGATYVSEVTPTYATNKAIQLVLGMPDVPQQLMVGLPQTNQYTKLIKGKFLKRVRRRSYHAGQTQKVAIGYDGVDNTKTLFAKCGDVKTIFLRLTGNPIDKLYSNQGFIRQYKLESGCCDDCGGDTCADIDPEVLADALIAKIQADPKLSAGNGQLVTATKTLTTVSGVKKAGVIIETAFVNRITGDCTYDYFSYDADTVHVEISEMNEDYNGSPCEGRFPVTALQDPLYPVGLGVAVRDQEIKSLGYFLKERSSDPAVREAESYTLNSDITKNYDEWTLEFDFRYLVLGWGQFYTDSHHVVIYVENGSSLSTALNTALTGWATSIGSSVEQEIL
jgi:hypothetical protein